MTEPEHPNSSMDYPLTSQTQIPDFVEGGHSDGDNAIWEIQLPIKYSFYNRDSCPEHPNSCQDNPLSLIGKMIIRGTSDKQKLFLL